MMPSPNIADWFEQLKRDGWLPSQALEVLFLQYAGGHILTPFPQPALGFTQENGRLVVRSDMGKLDPTRIPVRQAGPLDPRPVPFEPPKPSMAEHDALLQSMRLDDQPRTIDQFQAENPHAFKTAKEREAAKWLALKLSPNDAVTLGKHRAECRKKFGLSEIGYERRVWPAARWLVGLPPVRKAGAPKKGARGEKN
jgi:hypothetical protein